MGGFGSLWTKGGSMGKKTGNKFPVGTVADTTPPAITSANPSGTYTEGLAIGGTLTANESVNWSKSGADASRVTLNGSVWSLEATNAATKASYSWTFTATDTSGNVTNQAAAISIAAVVVQTDKTPPIITSSNPSASYVEGVSVGGTLTANESVTWSKSGADASAVTLDTSTGIWSLEATTFLTKASYAWTFTATDDAGNATNEIVAVSILAAPDTTAPVLSSPNDSATGTTTASISVTTNDATGTLYWYVSTSALVPTSAALKAGTGAKASGSMSVSAAGVQSVSVTGLSAATTYHTFFQHRDAAGNDSAIVFADGFTTNAATDTTAPVLSAPTDDPNGPNGGNIAVTTDEANGTLYWFVSSSATPPSAANLKSGSGAVVAGSLPITATGVKRISPTGLVYDTTYYAHFLHRDAAGNDSLIVSGDGFTTVASAYASTTSGLSSALATAKGGDIIALAAGSYGALTLSSLNFTSTVTILSADPNDPAHFTDTLTLSNCKNIRVTGLALSQAQTVNNFRPIVKVTGCTNVEIDHNTITGASTGSGYYGYGVVGSATNGLNVHHNTITDVYRAGTMDTIQNLKVNDNDHGYVQGDAWQCGSITTGEFQRNLFENFRTFGVGHVDCIQFYIRPISTNPGDIPSTNITIAYNLCANDPAYGRAQFSFTRSQETTKRFNNFTISHNVTYGTNWDSIQYIIGDNLACDYNDCFFIDSDADTITDAMIRCDQATGELTGNRTTKQQSAAGVTETGNTYDKALMTATLSDMATAKAAWEALYR